jgi:5'-3' exonuclease
MIALLDGDIFAFRVACTTENDPEGIATYRVNEMIEQCLAETEAKEYRIYLTGKNNFRRDIYPEYKQNRADKPKPKHLQFLRDYLVAQWNAEIADGMEADDYLAIHQNESTIICSIDKDLLQVKGKHYNFVKKEFSEVEELDGIRRFYIQLLTGDTSDNIKGIEGIGPVKANKALMFCETEKEMFDKVREMYNNDDWLLMNGRCLHILRSKDDDWTKTYERLLNEQG